MDCTQCVAKDAELALLKEQLPIKPRQSPIKPRQSPQTKIRSRFCKRTFQRRRPAWARVRRRQAKSSSGAKPFDDEHLGRDNEVERESQLVATLPSFRSTFVKGAFLSSISS